MAGMLLELVPKRNFSFDTLTVGQLERLFVVERIDISQYIDGLLIVRVHSVSATGGFITLDLLGDGFTDEDPSLIYGTLPTFASVTVDNGSPAGQLRSASATIRGRYAALRVTGNRSSAAAINASLSVALVLRSPDEL